MEFAGYYGRSAEELRKMLDDVGLKVAGSHVHLGDLQGEELDRTIEFNQTLGNSRLVIAWYDPKKMATRADIVEFGRALNEVAEKLKPHGMQTGYHNHGHEFKMVEGETKWDILAANTKAEVVMQLDMGNAMSGGGDAIAALERWADRGFTVHLKEHSSTKEAVLIGEGEVPWQEVFRICESAGNTEWYIVEQESYAYPPLECVERCLKNLM
ncbi:MAG: sugar phosphate isomerase/epimerase [Armatimonadetes bacterium]|nr:sugar phosphate isomerase/epimerase [Armatimonadota bacterium]